MAGTRYIGKLAAILTVNNSDLAPKLSGSAKQVSSFAKTVNSTISQATSSAAKSFNEIFTQTQKLGRALSVANRDPLNLNVDARKVEQLVLAANQLAKPLAAGVKGFGDLATSVQRQFDPALRQVQQSLKSVQAAIDANEAVGASTFRTLAADVGQTTAALSRLQERAAASSRLFRGNELTFVDPRGVDAINAVIAAQQRLANASSATRGSPIARDLIADAQILQEQYQRISARIERLNAEGLDITVSQTGLDRVIRDLETVARLTNDVAGGAQRGFRLVEAPREQRGLGLFGSSQGSAEEQAIARARQVSAEFARLPEAAQAGLRGLAGIASNVADGVQAGTSNATQLNAVLDRLSSQTSAEANLRAEQERRVAVASTLLRINQQESQLLSFQGQATNVDGSGRSLQQRFADIQATNDRAGAEANLRAEQERRVAVASTLLRIDEQESRLLSFQGQATNLGGRLADQGRRRVQGRTGDINIDSTPPAGGGFSGQAQRDIDALATRVGAVREQLETLPNSIRTRFIPELQRAQAQLIRLQNAPNATVQSIEAATLRVQRLEASARRAAAAFNFRQSFGGAGLRGIEEGLNQQALQGYTAQLQLLQQALAGTSQAARGPAVAAFNNLRNAIADAMERGTLEAEQTRGAIQRLTQEAVRATAAAAGVSPRGLETRLRRVGDIGRNDFGNVGLAVQQAAFAVDDFFSVTGGLDQRIRAAGNNISQLGFVIGSTGGLIAGIAISIGAQLVAALIKWSNAGTEAQDRTKALNEALARQKSLVEDLAQAFDALGDRLLRGVFSPAAEEARELSRQLDDIRRKQKELREGRVVDLDPEVQRQRSIQGALQRRLEGEEDVGRRIALQNQIAAARRAEQAAAQAAAGRTTPTAADVERGLRRTVFVDGQRGPSPANRRDLDQIGRDVGAAAGDPQQLISLLERAREQQEALALQNSFNQVRSGAARENVAALTRLIEGLQREVSTGVDAAGVKLVESIEGPAADLRAAQDRLRQAVEAGVPGARTLLGSVDEIGAGLDAAKRTIVDRLEQGLPLDQSTVGAASAQRDAALRNSEATLQQTREIDIARQALERFTAALDSASQEAQANLQSAQQAADQARRADLGRSTPQTRQAREQADADLSRQQDLASGVEQEIAAARERFGQRVGEVQALRRRAELATQATARDAETARRMGAAGIEGRGTYIGDAERARTAGNEDLARFIEETQSLVTDVRDSLGLDNENLWRGVFGAIDAYKTVVNDAASETERSLARVAEIDAQLGSEGVLAPGQREKLVRERARLQAGVIDQDELVRRARDASTREAEQAAAAVRGRDLSVTDGQRAAQDLARQLEDIRQFFGRQAEATTGLVDFKAQGEAQARAIQNAARQAAPMTAGFADEVRNALLQGPSRAALGATDASTVEGQRELNRLLRGDDSNRDVDLVNLQTEANRLLGLIAEKDAAPVAN